MATILNAAISQFPISKPSLCFQFHNRNHNRVSFPSKLSFKSVNIITRTHMNPSSVKCSILDKTIEGLRASGRGDDACDLIRKTNTGPELLHMIHGYHRSTNEVPGKFGDDVLSKLRKVISSLVSEERYQDALEVHQGINNWKERDEMTPEDTARQVYLITRVHGVPRAEKYLLKLPDAMKDKRTYSALLIRNLVAGLKMNAESLFHKMRNAGYASDEDSFYPMLKFYEDLKHDDKVELMISKMIEENIPLGRRSYNIWLWSCQSQESLDKIFKQGQLETTCRSSLHLFYKIAFMYNELGQLGKVHDCLKEIETRIKCEKVDYFNEDYTSLMNLCCSLRNRWELNRVWETYKSFLSKDYCHGYQTLIRCLFIMGDIEDAEKMYDEWFSRPIDSCSESESESESCVSYDFNFDEPGYNKRHHLLFCYAENGLFEKAETFFNQMIEAGIKPNPLSWEILAKIHIQGRRISKALSFLGEAFSARDKGLVEWFPSNSLIMSILEICEEEADMASKDALFEIFKEAGIDESHVTHFVTPHPIYTNFGLLS